MIRSAIKEGLQTPSESCYCEGSLSAQGAREEFAEWRHLSARWGPGGGIKPAFKSTSTSNRLEPLNCLGVMFKSCIDSVFDSLSFPSFQIVPYGLNSIQVLADLLLMTILTLRLEPRNPTQLYPETMPVRNITPGYFASRRVNYASLHSVWIVYRNYDDRNYDSLKSASTLVNAEITFVYLQNAEPVLVEVARESSVPSSCSTQGRLHSNRLNTVSSSQLKLILKLHRDTQALTRAIRSCRNSISTHISFDARPKTISSAM
ncbi:hypothetical protein R3P38DRAFT_2810973 [Favolaschia claudopus]|uniref:Uncharacterized protein n=1 Tax=Favolaschia claudopus TaxID=2862362 RepID=A0AAV9ZA27_9AGAR